jgi:hypothetical protein
MLVPYRTAYRSTFIPLLLDHSAKYSSEGKRAFTRMGSSSSNDIDKLIKETQEAIDRLEAAQKGGSGVSWMQRVSRHLNKHGNNLAMAALMGSVFVVAVGRLNDKYSHQVRRAGADIPDTEGRAH